MGLGRQWVRRAGSLFCEDVLESEGRLVVIVSKGSGFRADVNFKGDAWSIKHSSVILKYRNNNYLYY